MTHDFTSAHIKAGSLRDMVRHHIMAHASTAQGFSVPANRGDYKSTACQTACDWLVSKGFVVRAKRGMSDSRVFIRKDHAQVYSMSRQPPAVSLSATKLAQGISFKPGAEIVHTDRTRYSSRMMPDRYAVNVSLVRIGQPGFSMTVGGAA